MITAVCRSRYLVLSVLATVWIAGSPYTGYAFLALLFLRGLLLRSWPAAVVALLAVRRATAAQSTGVAYAKRAWRIAHALQLYSVVVSMNHLKRSSSVVRNADRIQVQFTRPLARMDDEPFRFGSKVGRHGLCAGAASTIATVATMPLRSTEMEGRIDLSRCQFAC